jgi:acetoin utilization deacetylase AcuC-like enzyme
VRGDPHGSWSLEPRVFAQIGALLAACERPICVVQEGGYAVDALAECAHAFATGLLGEGGRPSRSPGTERTTT